MRDLFYFIKYLFEDVLMAPYDALRALELESWLGSNFMSWIFLLIGLCAFIYWMGQLKQHGKNNEEDKSITSHSYLS